MAKSTAPPDRFGWLQDLNSVLASAICHFTALIVLGLLSASLHHATDAGLVVQLGDGTDAVNGEEGRLPGGAEFEATTNDASAANETEQPLTFQPVAPSEFAAVTAEFEPVAADLSNSMPAGDVFFNDAVSAKAVDRALAAASGLGGHGLGDSGDRDDAASGRGSPWGKEAGFFGINDYGQSFVYVVDCSDSMNENGKFGRTCIELLRALQYLSDKQRYFVIFFNDGAYPMDADGPVEATVEQVDRTRRWVERVIPGGGTNPLPALSYALSMRPDAIYFLSDGKFDPLVIQELNTQNRGAGKIPIHTISFVNRETVGIMRTISRNSGGKFRFVK